MMQPYRGRAALAVLFGGLLTASCTRNASVDSTFPAPTGHPASAAMSLPQGHPAVSAPAPGESVAGTVTLAPALRSKAPAGAALYLIARSAKDRQIVAVRKEDAPTFPHAFELTAHDAMTHGVPFAGALEITARLSRSGDAAPAPGDLEGRVAGVEAGSRAVRVQLDTERP